MGASDKHRILSLKQIGLKYPFKDVITPRAPYNSAESRSTVSGALTRRNSARDPFLAIHELATNALKYGALSVAGGHVSVTWRTEDHETSKFVFIWQEHDGPHASKPARLGFGSRLISRVLQEDFRGSVEVTYESTGLICRLTAPVEHLAVSPS